MAKSDEMRRVAADVVAGLEEVRRWVRGEPNNIKVTVVHPPAAVRRSRVRLPGGGVVSVELPATADPAADRRAIARIRRAVLPAAAI